MRVRLASAAIIVAVWSGATACSGSSEFRLTVRYRGGEPTQSCYDQDSTHVSCTFGGSPKTWQGADQTATSSAFRVVQPVLAGFGHVECGDESFTSVYWGKSEGPARVIGQPFQLELTDGSVLELTQLTWVSAAVTTALVCLDITGTWKGTQGRLSQHTGTYRLRYDTIQQRLDVVES